MFVFFLIHVCVGSSCRTRVTKHLKKAYPSLCDAEDAYGVDYFFLFLLFNKDNSSVMTIVHKRHLNSLTTT